MKKILIAAVLGLALCALPSVASAAPPGFYAGGYYSTPFPGPMAQGFNYYSSPYGYRTYNTYGFGLTPWGPTGYSYGATFVRPYVNAPRHSVYWDPFNNTYQYSTGYMNTPTFYNYYRFGW
jgi:hypothetical protein